VQLVLTWFKRLRNVCAYNCRHCRGVKNELAIDPNDDKIVNVSAR
jgi:hypothetical protein